MHKEGFLFVSSRDFLWPEFMLVSLAVSGQWSDGERKKQDAKDQRPEIEGQKKDETGEIPGSEATAA